MPSYRSLSFVALLGLIARGPVTAATLAEFAEAIDRPHLSAPLGAPPTIRLGRGSLVPKPGASMRLLLARGMPVGVWVSGPVEFHYRVEDRFSQPVARRNFARASTLETTAAEDALSVSTPVEWAVVWSLDFEVASVPPATDDALPASARELIERALFTTPAVDLLLARHHSPPVSGLSYTLLHTPREDLLLEVDPIVSRVESLFRVVKLSRDDSVELAGSFFVRELAAQPIGREWWRQFPADVVVTHEALEVVNDRDSHVRVTSRLRLQALAGSSRLFAARLASSISDGNRPSPVTVRSVTIGGKPTDYVHAGGDLLIALEPELVAGQSLEVEVVHEGELAQRSNGDSFWALGTWPWYPKPPLNAELATIEMTVRVPPSLTPFASGRTLSRQLENGLNVLRTRLDQPMSFPVVAAGKYHTFSDEQSGVRVQVASYGQADEVGAKRLLNNFFAAEECYRRKLNTPFPFPELTVLELKDWGRGQAPSGLIFITQEAFNSVLAEEARLFSEGVNERYLHEIAHAYWGHALKFPSMEENWLSESFASYSAVLCLDVLAGKNASFKLEHFVRRWQADVERLGAGASIYLAERLAGKGFQDASDRRTLLYGKGPLVLHALRLELRRRAKSDTEGDRQFLILLRSFLKNFPYQWGSTADFVAILEQMTGARWQPWFERYVYGTEVPELR